MQRFTILLAALSALVVSPAHAAEVTLGYVDSGWYTDEGEHDSLNLNYLTGAYDGSIYHSFMLFDLGSIDGTITAAQVRLYNPSVADSGRDGYQSPDPSEQLSLFNVETAHSVLTQSHAADRLPEDVAIFDDLGSGTLLGSQTVSAADNGQFVIVTLNADAITELNAARGSTWAVGGALTSLRASPVFDELVFGLTTAGHERFLILETIPVPEPSAVVLLGIATVGLAATAIRRRHTAA